MYFSSSLIFVVLCVVASPIYIHGWPSNNEISCHATWISYGYEEMVLRPRITTSGKESSNNLKSRYSYPSLLAQECSTTIIAPAGYGIVVSLRIFDLLPKTGDTLSIKYKPHAQSTTLETKRYTNIKSVQLKERNKDVIYSAGDVKVLFKTADSYGAYTYDGFELVYTVVRNSSFVSGCSTAEFPCRNERCISKELRCDGYNHCGDRSEQEDCGFSIIQDPPSLGRKIGIGVGTAFFLIAVFLGIYLLIRSRKSNVTTTTTTAMYPPTVCPPAPHPSYPQQLVVPPYGGYPQRQY